MRENLNGLISTDFTELKQFEEYINSRENCFVGWVDSFNDNLGTINVQPAIQNKLITQDNSIQYQNKPFLINCWVVANTLNRNPQKGDKCLVMVLDEKSNNFFKAQYDSSLPLQQQTNVNTSKARKSTSNCVAVIINPNFINGGSGSVKWGDIGGDIKNQTDLYKWLTDLQKDISDIQGDYVTLDTKQTIQGRKQFLQEPITRQSSGFRGYRVHNIGYTLGDEPTAATGLGRFITTDKDGTFISYLQTIVSTDGKTTTQLLNRTKSDSGTFVATSLNLISEKTGSYRMESNCSFMPSSSNAHSLGSTTNKWKNLYLAGNLSDGTNNILVKNIKQTIPISVGSDTASLSSYWFPVWKQTKALGNYNEISYLLNIGTAYQISRDFSLRGLMSFQVRQNTSTDALEILLELYNGNLSANYFKVYQNEDGLLELWVNVSTQYIRFAGEVLSIYGLGDTEHYNIDPFGKWYNQNFTEIQTPIGTDITSKVVVNNSGIVNLHSPVRIWNLTDGIYKLPASCIVYYKGATSTDSFTVKSSSILIINSTSTYKYYSIFGSQNDGHEILINGAVTSTTGTYYRNTITATLINTRDPFTITGSSTYTGDNKIKATYIDVTTTPASTQYKFLDFIDKNNTRIGIVGVVQQQGDGVYGTYLQAGNFGSMGVIGTSTSNVRGYAPTPPTNDNSNSIATTEWVNKKLSLSLYSHTIHIRGTNNNIILTIYNTTSNLFTISTLKQWLYDNGFNGTSYDQAMYECSGSTLNGNGKYHGISAKGSATGDTFGAFYSDNNGDHYSNTTPVTSIIDTVVQIL